MVTDSAGRPVALPPRLARVLPTGNAAAAALTCIARDRLLGWPEPPPGERPPAHPAGPLVPRLNTHELGPSVEAVRAVAPDLVLDFGVCAPAFVAFADRLQAETGVPVVVVDGRLERSPDSLRLLGRLFAVEARGEALARAFERLWGEVEQAGAGPRVHYAIGPRGEKTVRRGSIHLDVLAMLGADFVAEVEIGHGGRVSVAPEAVARADPEVILTIDVDFHTRAGALEVWADMAAVRPGRVYLAPAPVLSWLDYPPGPNRIIGLAWLARLFYGRAYGSDLAEAARAFHRLFYDTNLDRAALAAALAKAGVG